MCDRATRSAIGKGVGLCNAERAIARLTLDAAEPRDRFGDTGKIAIAGSAPGCTLAIGGPLSGGTYRFIDNPDI